MWLDLLQYGGLLVAGGSLGGPIGWAIRDAAGFVTPNPKLITGKTEADLVKQGWDAVDKMANDIHALYHPVGCKCAMCEIKADDTDPEPPAVERCAEPCYGCSVITCPRHPDHDAPTRKVCHKPPHVELDEHYTWRYAKELEKKVKNLTAENKSLRAKNEMFKGLEQVGKWADQEQQPAAWSSEIDGRAVTISVGPQREPDQVIVKHGGEVVRKIWNQPTNRHEW